MGKEWGSEPLGSFYTTGKVRNRREWRGLKDTFYDYTRWLHIMGILSKFIVKPRNIKAFFRYRWMANYLAAPMMVDRHTQGLRGPQLRIAHTEFDLVMADVAKLLDNLFKADRRIGNDKKLSDKVVLMDENEMTAVMMGFPTLKGLSRETPAVYVSVLLNQYGACHYIDVAQEYGLPGDVCPMPEAEAGVSIDDDFPILGTCATPPATDHSWATALFPRGWSWRTACPAFSWQRPSAIRRRTCRNTRPRKSGTVSSSLKSRQGRTGTGMPISPVPGA